MSDWNDSARKRKLTRQAPAVSDVAKPRARKNTRLWCRGVEGRNHQLVCEPEKRQTFSIGQRYALFCKACGKTVDSWTDYSAPELKKTIWPQFQRPRPNWVPR